MYYTYEVCVRCGKILSTRKTTMNGEDVIDGKNYVKATREHDNCKPKEKENPNAWYKKSEL